MPNSFPFSDPVAISRDTAKSLGVEMIDLRRGLGALSAPMHGNTFGTQSGVFPGGTSGSGPSNDLQCSGTSGLTASFNAGHYAVDRGTGNLYFGFAYSGWSVTLDVGDAVNPRIDAVVVRVRDPGLPGDGTVNESAKPTILKGSPAANPSKPTGQLTNGDLVLAWLTVGGGSNANSIIAVEDPRLFIEARGAIRVRTPWDTRPGAYEGQCAYNLVAKALEVWDGSEWKALASPAEWLDFTPVLYSGGTGPSWTPGGTVVGMGTNAKRVGRYLLTGKKLELGMTFTWGNAPWNAGDGDITSRLPAGLKSRKTGGEQHFFCHLYFPLYGSTFPGQVLIREDSNVLWFEFPNSPSDVRHNFYKIGSGSGGSVPAVTNGRPEGGILSFSGTFEIQ